MACPCGSELELEACCGLYLSGKEKPPTAESLMRARYTAYVVGDIDFVEKTHDPKTRASFERASAEAWARTAQWLGLEILSTEAGGVDDDIGGVEFVARYKKEGSALAHHERSRFRRVQGAWHFTDGDTVGQETYVREGPKVGRNDPCPCGSGKKYKKCHAKA